jgi:hypothetical protein
MDNFLSKIQQQLDILNEQEPGQPPADQPPAEEPPMDAPADVPVEPESELPGEDDTSKLKIDYVEMVRKALIMAPKHIDDVDYARLTKVVDTNNLDEMQELVSRIVRNNYPHPDFEA